MKGVRLHGGPRDFLEEISAHHGEIIIIGPGLLTFVAHKPVKDLRLIVKRGVLEIDQRDGSVRQIDLMRNFGISGEENIIDF